MNFTALVIISYPKKKKIILKKKKKKQLKNTFLKSTKYSNNQKVWGAETGTFN